MTDSFTNTGICDAVWNDFRTHRRKDGEFLILPPPTADSVLYPRDQRSKYRRRHPRSFWLFPLVRYADQMISFRINFILLCPVSGFASRRSSESEIMQVDDESILESHDFLSFLLVWQGLSLINVNPVVYLWINAVIPSANNMCTSRNPLVYVCRGGWPKRWVKKFT